MTQKVRHFVLVLGDQLGWDSAALSDFDPEHDRLLMIEADSEAGEVWNHQARIALFLSGMRHFANAAHQRQWPCTYLRLDDPQWPATFAERLAQVLSAHPPQALLVMEAMKMEHTIAAPGEGTVKELLYGVGDQVGEGAALITLG